MFSTEEQLSENFTRVKIKAMAGTINRFYTSCIHLFGTKTSGEIVNMIETDLLGFSLFHHLPQISDYESPVFKRLHEERTKFYHTTFHCFDLAQRAHSLAIDQRIAQMTKFDAVALMLAGFYHDYGHSHGEQKDDVNVGVALAKFIADTDKHSELFKVDYLQELKQKVIDLITFSKYPYEEITKPDMADLCETFRLLDVLQSLEMDVYASQQGLYNEMKLDMSIDEFLEKSAEFVLQFNHHGTVSQNTAANLRKMAASNIVNKSSTL